MLAPVKVNQIERLLAEQKYSLREIARRTGISRATIGVIARGERPDYEARRRAQKYPDELEGPRERCPGCGGMVRMPCRLCLARRVAAERQAALLARQRRLERRMLRELLVAIRRLAMRSESEFPPRRKAG